MANRSQKRRYRSRSAAKYEPVIGLEVQRAASDEFEDFLRLLDAVGDAPNSNVCPVCLGLPGTLPVLNKARGEMATLASLVPELHGA